MNPKKASRIALPALALAALMACLSGGDGGAGGSGWYGVIRNTCGPADGPALIIRVEEEPVASCVDAVVDDSLGLYLLYVDGLLVDSLKPGTVIKDTVSASDQLGFGKILTLTVEKADQSTVGGRLQIDTLRNGAPATEAKGRIELKVCPSQYQLCG